MERIMDIMQSVLTYLCTGGLACILGYVFRVAKRITVLEEHDKEHLKTAAKIDNISERVIQMDVKLDLLLKGKLRNGVDE